MRAVFIVLLAIVALAAASQERQTQLLFNKWMRDNGKVYATEDFQARYAIWKDNFEFVTEFNKQNVGFTVAMNKFADLTITEFSAIYKGLKQVSIPEPTVLEEVDTSALPASVDWRQKGVVTGVKNQGQCGSCWSFSTTGSVEGAHAINTGTLVSLSEQNLVDCSTRYGNMGCNGGLMDQAFKYIEANKGIDTEASYPYTATGPNACRFSAAHIGATISGYRDVPSGNEAKLEEFIADAPTSVAIDASHRSFQLYHSGVYNEPACSSTQLDHGVLAVGYGAENGHKYYIVKNSWGAGWGMQGYILMTRGARNQCGIATAASRPLA